MPTLPLREESTVYVGHQYDSSPAFGFLWIGTETRYRTAAHLVRRPASGETVIEIQCATCEKELLLRVRSIALSQLMRRRSLITALVGLAVTALAIAIGLVSEYAGAPIPLSTALGAVLVTAVPVGLATVGVGAYGWYNEASIRLYTATELGDETHRLLAGARPHDALAP